MNFDVVKRGLLVFLPLALIAAATIYLYVRSEDAVSRAVAESFAKQATDLAALWLRSDLADTGQDALYVANLAPVRRWISSGTEDARRAATDAILTFAEFSPAYAQLQIIDDQGRERIRVDRRSKGELRAVDASALQDKSDRYYVADTRALDGGEVYVSPFDLNVENGRVEVPYNPVIRFVTPFLNAEGERRGIVVLNYLGAAILHRLRLIGHGVDPDGAPPTAAAQIKPEIRLINADGYWLIGPTPEDEWGFMIEGREERKVATRFPGIWKRIGGAAQSGQFFDAGNLVTYRWVTPGRATSDAARDASSLIVVSLVTASAFALERTSLQRKIWPFGLSILLLLAVSSWLIGRHWSASRRAWQGVADSEARFRSLVEAAPDAVVITDTEGRIVLVNKQTEQLFGYARDRLIGRDVEILVPARNRAQHVGLRSGYVAKPTPRPMGAGLELFGVRADGTEFPVAISLSPVDTGDGVLVVADIRDVSDAHAAAKEIDNLNKRLRHDNVALNSVNRELEAFSYSVSHDLRAPLRAIDGFGQALLEDCAHQLSGDGKDYLMRVRRATQRMAALIDDLLTLSKVTRSEITISRVDLSALATEIVASLRERNPTRNVDVDIHPEVTVSADARLMRLALENLLGNAWKFTAERPDPHIEFGSARLNGQLVQYVRDNGAGFDMAYADKLFGAFQRLHEARRFEGTGIGLATVQRAINKLGGRIWAEAEPDRGATFYFTV